MKTYPRHPKANSRLSILINYTRSNFSTEKERFWHHSVLIVIFRLSGREPPRTANPSSNRWKVTWPKSQLTSKAIWLSWPSLIASTTQSWWARPSSGRWCRIWRRWSRLSRVVTSLSTWWIPEIQFGSIPELWMSWSKVQIRMWWFSLDWTALSYYV